MLKLEFQRTLLLSVFLLFALSGCVKSYKPRSLSFAPQQREKQGGVEVTSKRLNAQETEAFLGRDIAAKGYTPVQLSIRNDSNKTFVFDTAHVSVPVEKPLTVAHKLHDGATGRIIAWLFGALYYWPLLGAAALDGLNSHYHNKRIDRFFSKHAHNVDEELTIAPGTRTQTVVFIENKDEHAALGIELVEQNGETRLTYNL